MKTSRPFYYFTSFCCFLGFAAFGWYAVVGNSAAPEAKADFASTAAYETAAQCGSERNYFANELKKVSPTYRATRSEVHGDQPPRECVSFIMQNFLPLNQASPEFTQCQGKDEFSQAPVRGSMPPCVTEDYVNSVYNALADVSDCLNIPMKELLPKLYNESGLHINILGGGYDAGVGQLTASALWEVYMPYDGIPGNPSALDWYVRQIGKSSKASCKRIIATPSAYTLDMPKGKKKCSYGQASDPSCYTPWTSGTRCTVMTVPDNPVRNVLFTGVFYRSMLKNATGLSYFAGEDYLNGRPYRPGDDVNGYIGGNHFVERMKALGATHADQNVIKQMIVSLGFNAGIDAGKNYLNNYLKQKEAHKGYLRDSDVDFIHTDTGKWAIITNLPTFWRGLSGTDADLNKALSSLEVLGTLKLDVAKAQKMYRDLQPFVLKDLAKIDALKIAQADKDKMVTDLKVKYDKYRHPLLAAVFAQADSLTLPEFMRIAHANSIALRQGGGAPGYLSFIASMYTKLEKNMGARVCTPDKYLQF